MLLAVTAVVYVVSTLPGMRSTPTFVPLVDGWFQGTAFLLTAVVAALRVVVSPVDRLLWSLVAVALALRAFGYITYFVDIRTRVPQPYPSLADAGWLASSVVLLAALTVLVRPRARQFSLPLVLDAVVAALTAGGVAVALLWETLVARQAPGASTSVVTVNLAYPLLDVALLVLCAGYLTLVRWRPTLTLPRPGGRHRRLRRHRRGVPLPGHGRHVPARDRPLGTQHAGDRGRSRTPGGSTSAPATPPQRRTTPSSVTPRRWFLGRSAGRPPPGGVRAGLLRVLVYVHVQGQPPTSSVLPLAGILVVCVRGVATLFSERIAAEQEMLLKNDELLRFQSLVEASGDFIAIASIDGSVIYLNPAGRELVGLDPDIDVTKTTIADYLTEEGIKASLEIEQPAVVAHGHWEGESTLRNHRGGRPIPVAISSFVMLHPVTREPMALATVQRDITERLIAQSALQDLADQRQELLDRLVQAQEDERARIAADVHDDSVQALAAVELRLGLLRRRLAERAPDLVESVDQMAETVEHRDRPAPPPALRPGLPRAARRPRRRARPGRVVRLRGRPGLDGHRRPQHRPARGPARDGVPDRQGGDGQRPQARRRHARRRSRSAASTAASRCGSPTTAAGWRPTTSATSPATSA